jgi:hypothetical protein
VLHAGLKRSAPSITRDEVDKIFDCISTETLDDLHFELCKLNFPRWAKEFEEARAERKRKEAAGEPAEDEEKNG